jgi:hypothetical protein
LCSRQALKLSGYTEANVLIGSSWLYREEETVFMTGG